MSYAVFDVGIWILRLWKGVSDTRICGGMSEKALMHATLRRNIEKPSYTYLQQHRYVENRSSNLEYIVRTLSSYILYIYLSYILCFVIISHRYIASFPK